MQVKATKMGYFNHKRIKAGTIINLNSEKEYSKKWMVKLDAKGNEIPEKEELTEAKEAPKGKGGRKAKAGADSEAGSDAPEAE